MRRTVKAVGIAGKRNRLDQVLVRDENRHMTVRDAIREFEPHNLALEEQRANLIELEKDFEKRKRPQQYERIKDGCREILRPVKEGERVVVEAMREEELKRLVGKKYVFVKGGRGRNALRLILHAQEEEINRLKIALRDERLSLKVQEDPWRRFREDPPEPGQLVAIAVLQFDKKSWNYTAEITDRDSIEYWKLVESDVRWMPLQEVEA